MSPPPPQTNGLAISGVGFSNTLFSITPHMIPAFTRFENQCSGWRGQRGQKPRHRTEEEPSGLGTEGRRQPGNQEMWRRRGRGLNRAPATQNPKPDCLWKHGL